jgi:hypothetical protein
VKAAIGAGRKIEAIKVIREQTGLGLAEAKYAMEKLEAELREREPEIFPLAKPKGCSVGMVLLLVLAVGLSVCVRT